MSAATRLGALRAAAFGAARFAAPELTEGQRRDRLVYAVSLSLAVMLGVSSVLSAVTTVAFPDPSVSLGWRGTIIIAVAAGGFSLAHVTNRRARFTTGAWLTIVTIYAFLLGFGLSYPQVRSGLTGAYVVPVLLATILLDVNGTIAMLVVSVVLSVLSLLAERVGTIPLAATVAALAVAGALTTIVAQLRHQDLLQVLRLRELEHADAERIRRELALARTVQEAMLPTDLPRLGPFDVAAFSRAASEASGDFYDVFEIEHLPPLPGQTMRRKGLAITVGDVAGKGLPAALIMAATRAAVRAEAGRTTSPAAVLSRVNQQLVRSVPPGLFVTMVYAIADPDRAELRFSSGGHPHPLLWQHATGSVSELETYGLPLGLDSEATYDDATVALGSKDLLVLYSDGLVEAHNAEAAMFGFDGARLEVGHAAAGSVDERPRAAATLDRVLATLWGFVGDVPLADDTTLVVVAVDPAGVVSG